MVSPAATWTLLDQRPRSEDPGDPWKIALGRSMGFASSHLEHASEEGRKAIGSVLDRITMGFDSFVQYAPAEREQVEAITRQLVDVQGLRRVAPPLPGERSSGVREDDRTGVEGRGRGRGGGGAVITPAGAAGLRAGAAGRLRARIQPVGAGRLHSLAIPVPASLATLEAGIAPVPILGEVVGGTPPADPAILRERGGGGGRGLRIDRGEAGVDDAGAQGAADDPALHLRRRLAAGVAQPGRGWYRGRSASR